MIGASPTRNKRSHQEFVSDLRAAESSQTCTRDPKGLFHQAALVSISLFLGPAWLFLHSESLQSLSPLRWIVSSSKGEFSFDRHNHELQLLTSVQIWFLNKCVLNRSRQKNTDWCSSAETSGAVIMISPVERLPLLGLIFHLLSSSDSSLCPSTTYHLSLDPELAKVRNIFGLVQRMELSLCKTRYQGIALPNSKPCD